MCPDDAQVAAFLDGALDADEVSALSEHLAGCHACRQVVSAGARAVSSPGASLERYVLLQELGAGSMGVVFAAWDKRLDRRVALKMLHQDSEAARQERLEREARALARLSHPNVVAVYDVGRGDDGLYVSMEYVDGQTMRQWLLERPRSAAEILAVFRAAGEGLRAAHDAGLVHRDFKPDNVLIGRDGRVRVSDFGLAHVGSEVRPPVALPLGLASLTHSGLALGTPAYMAPEALTGGRIDARSDQFSFCVALWEALAGRRPFIGRTVADLERTIAEGRVEGSKLPRAVEVALRRGLSADPSRRFPSIGELLETLEPKRPPRRWLLPTVVVLALVPLAWSALRPVADACAGAPALIEPVWSPTRSTDLSLALSSAAPGSSASSVLRVLDGWSGAWVAARTEACRATQRKEQSEALLDQRMHCFDGQLKDGKALIEALVKADAALATRALDVASALPSPDGCSGARVAQRVALPSDRARLEALTDELARLKAVALSGRFLDAAKGAEALAADARSLRYPPLVAAGLVLQGTMLERLNDFARSNEVLVEALAEASRGRDDEQAIAALTQLAYVTGFRRSNLQQGLEWVTLGRALLERLEDVRLEADLEASHSIVLREAGRLADALEHEERRARLLGSIGPSGELGLAQSMVRRGRLLSDLGRYDEARALLEQAVVAQRRLLGPTHPDLASTLNPLSMACRRSGDVDCAVRAGEEALAVGSAAMGPESLEVGYTLNHLGNVYAVRGDWKRAHEVFERVLRIGEKHLGTEHHEVGMAHANLCWALRWLRRLPEADAECSRADALVPGRLGPTHPYSLEVRRLEATLVRLRGAPLEAIKLQERLLVDVEKVRGADHMQVAEVRADLGLSLFASGRRAEAVAALERAGGFVVGNATKAERGELGLALGQAKADCARTLEGRRELEAGGARPEEWEQAAPLLARCAK